MNVVRALDQARFQVDVDARYTCDCHGRIPSPPVASRRRISCLDRTRKIAYIHLSNFESGEAKRKNLDHFESSPNFYP